MFSLFNLMCTDNVFGVDLGEAYHSGEANDLLQCPIEVFAIDGITERADCDAIRDIDNANKLQLVPVSKLMKIVFILLFFIYSFLLGLTF